MGLQSLRLKNFRCFKELNWLIETPAIIVQGSNGSGKTSVLEAIHFLSRGRSFRTHLRDPLISHHTDGLIVQGHLSPGSGHASTLGISYADGQIKAVLNGLPVSRIADLATALPVQIIDHQAHALITGGPAHRRRLLDWGVFHREPHFHENWHRYEKALRQRNAVLRQAASARIISAWDSELITAGNVIDRLRRAYVLELAPIISALVARVLLHPGLEIHYRSGWPQESSLEQSLKQGLTADQQQRQTRHGPHRADLQLSLQGMPVQNFLSRGQEKILGMCLLLAQIAHLDRLLEAPIVVLADDIVSELDRAHLERLMGEFRSFKAQIFFTAIDGKILAPYLQDLPHRMFHVERGELRQMI